MTDDEFRSFFQRSSVGSDGLTLNALRAELTDAGPEAIRQFGALLTNKVAALASDDHVDSVGRVDKFVASGAGSDHFDYICAAVVAAGPDAYSAVLADPALLASRDWDDDMGDELLALPADLFDRVSAQPYDDDEPLAGSQAVDLHVVLETYPPDMPVWRRVVSLYSGWIGETADAWGGWWKPSGLAGLEVWMEVEGERAAAAFKLKTGKKLCSVELVRVLNEQLSVEGQCAAAEEDTRWVIAQVRTKFGLGEPPAIPAWKEFRSAVKWVRRATSRESRR